MAVPAAFGAFKELIGIRPVYGQPIAAGFQLLLPALIALEREDRIAAVPRDLRRHAVTKLAPGTGVNQRKRVAVRVNVNEPRADHAPRRIHDPLAHKAARLGDGDDPVARDPHVPPDEDTSRHVGHVAMAITASTSGARLAVR